jgi:phosphoribosyl-AMP cyclohydrolase
MFIGKKPTDAPLTSSDITDGIISTAKIADDAVTAAKASFAPGKVLQVATASLASNTSTTSTSFTASGLDIDFTPSLATSKVLIFWYMNNYAITSNTRTHMTVYRDSTNLGHSSYGLLTGYTNVHHGYPMGSHILDTPNTTSQIHYEVYVTTNAGTLWYGGHDSSGITNYITCMEIGA